LIQRDWPGIYTEKREVKIVTNKEIKELEKLHESAMNIASNIALLAAKDAIYSEKLFALGDEALALALKIALLRKIVVNNRDLR